jgi:hypothetical protein
MGHDDATDTVQLTHRSATREGIGGKDVRRKMGFVEIHASERDGGCLLGTVALVLVVLVHYIRYFLWTNAATIMRRRGENPLPQYTPSKSPFSLKKASRHILYCGPQVSWRIVTT